MQFTIQGIPKKVNKLNKRELLNGQNCRCVYTERVSEREREREREKTQNMRHEERNRETK